MTAEVGRQPWIVYNLMRTVEGTSPAVSATDVALSIGAIVVLYSLLLFLWLYAIRKEIIAGPDPDPNLVAEPVAPPAVEAAAAADGGN
jgi:cytochrome d ubiquinol oxidase subunit I